MTIVEVLIGARAKIAQGWCKGVSMRDAAGHEATEKTATCWCSIAACCVVAGNGYAVVGDAAVRILAQLVPAELLSIWQDAPDRTQAEVLALFDQAIVEEQAAQQQREFTTADYQVGARW